MLLAVDPLTKFIIAVLTKHVVFASTVQSCFAAPVNICKLNDSEAYVTTPDDTYPRLPKDLLLFLVGQVKLLSGEKPLSV